MPASSTASVLKGNKAIVTGESAQYRQSDGTHIWYNAASVSGGATSTLTERMRITSAGNVEINSYLNINGVTGGTSTYQEWRNNDALFAYNGSAAAIISGGSSTDYVAGNTTGGTSVILATNNTERFKISGTGDIGINVAPSNGIRVLIKGYGTTSGTRSLQANNGNNQDMFYINDDGSGFLKASAWTYGSDISLKENITDHTLGLNFVNALRPVTYNWKKEKDVDNSLKYITEMPLCLCI